jgi:hypothetical protein
MNVVGGYVVTDRMLEMFRPHPRPAKSLDDPPAEQAVPREHLRHHHVLYLAGAVCFVLGLHDDLPNSARRQSDPLSAWGSRSQPLAVLIHDRAINSAAATALTVGLLVGAASGLVTARRVKMTAMPW